MASSDVRIAHGDLTDSDSEGETCHPATAPSPCSCTTVAEVFSGVGALSKACEEFGFKSMQFDLLNNESHDMSKATNMEFIKSVLLTNNVKYCHFAPPCNTFSAARFPKLRLPDCKDLFGHSQAFCVFTNICFQGIPLTSVRFCTPKCQGTCESL